MSKKLLGSFPYTHTHTHTGWGKNRVIVVHKENNTIIINNNTRTNSCTQSCEPTFAPPCISIYTIYCVYIIVLVKKQAFDPYSRQTVAIVNYSEKHRLGSYITSHAMHITF